MDLVGATLKECSSGDNCEQSFKLVRARVWASLWCEAFGPRVQRLCVFEAERNPEGHPYKGICERTGEPVFLKLLGRSKADPTLYCAAREVSEVSRMLATRITHNHLVRIRAVLQSANAYVRGTLVEMGLVAIVTDFHAFGDLHDALFKPIQPRETEDPAQPTLSPRPFPEAIARHFIRQIGDAVRHLHVENISHRDIKPENVVFDESYNAILTDFGSAIYTPSAALDQPRASTGIYSRPDDKRMWRVGTEAYAPPEAFAEPGQMSYDPQKYDVWSLGVILFLMCCIDKLEVVGTLSPDSPQPKFFLRMPFQTYQNVVLPKRHGFVARNSLMNQLDVPTQGEFDGRLESPAPRHERFWQHFSGAGISDSLRDLLNRMLMYNPHQRISMDEVFKHPWLANNPMPTKEEIRAEMALRAPTDRAIGQSQFVHLPPDPQQWVSMAELRRNQQLGGPSRFPSDDTLANCVFSCGRRDGGGAYAATRKFVLLTTHLTSLNILPRNFNERWLRFSGCTMSDDGVQRELFVVQIFLLREEVFILLSPGADAGDEFPLWRDRIETFAENQKACQNISTSLSLMEGGRRRAHQEEEQASLRRVRQNTAGGGIREMSGGVTADSEGNGVEGSRSAFTRQFSTPRAPSELAASEALSLNVSGAGAGPAGDALDREPSLGSGRPSSRPPELEYDFPESSYKDWSWPAYTEAERKEDERLFTAQLGFEGRDDQIGRNHLRDYLVRTEGIEKYMADYLISMVVGEKADGTIGLQAFLRVRFLLRGLREGRLPPVSFPKHAFGERLVMSQAAAARQPGTEQAPLRYDVFAFLFRPLLHEACKQRNFMYQKIAPTAVLFERGRSPFKPRRGSLKVEEYVMCNIFASSLDTWRMKEVNFMDAYRPVDRSCYQMLEEGVSAEQPGLREWWRSISALTRDDRDDGEGPTPHDYMTEFNLNSLANSTEAIAKLKRLQEEHGPNMVWRLAMPNNCVVAEKLTETVLRSVFRSHGIPYSGGVMFREETWSKAQPFQAGDWVVSDVRIATDGNAEIPGKSQWQWKQLNKVYRGQTLITRTIDAATFQQTYRLVH